MQEKFLTGVQVNFFAAAVLVLIIVNTRKRPDREDYTQKLYWSMVLANLTMIVIDISVNAINGRGGELLRLLHIALETMDYVLSPLVGIIWALYVERRIDRDRDIVKRNIVWLVIPFVFNAVLLAMNFGRGFMFYIDEMNIYSRGEFFWISVAVTYFYLIYSFVKILKNRADIRRSEYKSLLLFPTIPFIGGLVQSFFYGVTLMWTSVAFSMLIVFINIQNDQLNRDHLTGLYNRRQLDRFLDRHIKYGEGDRLLGGVMIDVNDFKSVNDKYGHVEGDKALECIGDMLIQSFRREDFVARYAGDEFMVLSKVEDYQDLERMVKRLLEDMDDFNDSKYLPYKIYLSIGYDILDKDLYKTSEAFVKHIDELMYNHKKG